MVRGRVAARTVPAAVSSRRAARLGGRAALAVLRAPGARPLPAGHRRARVPVLPAPARRAERVSRVLRRRTALHRAAACTRRVAGGGGRAGAGGERGGRGGGTLATGTGGVA